MRIPQRPPEFDQLLRKLKDVSLLAKVLSLSHSERSVRHYLHWDKLRRYQPPQGHTREEWWFALKMARMAVLKPIPLQDKEARPFQFCVPDIVSHELHKIDVGAGAPMSALEPITNPQTRDRYLIRSLMEEAITSSQLEGAVTTRQVAKEMIRTGRPPRDVSEHMILNNYLTMQEILRLKSSPLSADMVFEIHRRVTANTLDDHSAAGRFRRPDEKRVVGDDFGVVYHDPPPASQLPDRLQAMCDFGNGKTPDFFVHPALRAIILHFWLAYDHPFVDGNGRTARALFYWGMLNAGYWLFEFISISNILRKAPIKYGRSFLYSETDDNDVTYFLVAQVRVIRRAIEELHAYIDRKVREQRELESHMRTLSFLNHRQAELVRHALKHPYQQYTVASHQNSHRVVYQTARTDLLDLSARGLLEQRKRGKQMVFSVPPDLNDRLKSLLPGASANSGAEKSPLSASQPAQLTFDARSEE